MRKVLTLLIPAMLAMLLLPAISLTMAELPPPLPMTVHGYVFIGEQRASAGYLVWAKVGTEPVPGANCTTDAEGYYLVAVSGPADDTPIDMWVENFNVTRIPMKSGTIVDLNLTIPTLAPTANFTATPTSGVEPLTVQFTDTSTNFKNITGWFWNFGDGTNSTERNPTHTYRQDGNYTVSLTVVGDGENITLTETKPNYITVFDSKPNADFYGTPLFGAPPLTVQFYDLSTSYDGIISRLWNFGDNTTSTEKNPKHTYTNEGIYTVSLNVTEADGDWDREAKTNYVIVTTTIAGPINVMIDTNPIHFLGETAEFYIMTLDSRGIPIDVNFTEHRLWFYYANENHFIDLPKPIQIEGGVYRTYYQIPLNAPQVTYTLVVTAKQVTPEGTSYGGAIKSFEINPTLTGWNTWIKEIRDNIATIVIPGLTEIKADLTAINARLIDIQQTTATINSTLGLIQTDIANINAQLISLNNTTATINSTLGLIQTSVDAIHLKVVGIDWETKIANIQTTLGTIQGYVENVDDGGLATINTALGTVKTNVSDILEKGVPIDLTPVWIAVAFSILAFLVATATAYMLRSKLA
ncbi:MAG: PKD domain-containing protein [Candidatus Bathyarchaeia archaeon]|nr:PKD domain-containing protein [Candidatus Bathyarchaeia archaeon]